jgi:spore coat polysaccharide biosynthesis protein SpsF
MTRRAGILVFARMSSSRLPGKALRDFGGMPLIVWVLRRASGLPYPVFLATSSDPSDDALASVAEGEGIGVHRGSLDDVLGRALGAARRFDLDVVARLCGDRPYFDTGEMADAIELALADPSIDLVSNWLPGRTAPGLTTEVMTRAAIERAASAAMAPEAREHLTQWMYAEESAIRVRRIESRANSITGRFAVDTLEDLHALQPPGRFTPLMPLDELLFGSCHSRE